MPIWMHREARGGLAEVGGVVRSAGKLLAVLRGRESGLLIVSVQIVRESQKSASPACVVALSEALFIFLFFKLLKL